MRLHVRRTLLLAAFPVVAAMLPAAAAGDTGFVPDTTPVTVALALRPASRAALAAAGTAPTDVRRLAAARAAAPPAGAGAEAAAYLRSRGFTVGTPSRWLVTARGTAAAARAAFGADLVSARGYVRPKRAVGVPAALRSHVSAVLGLDTSPRWRPRLVPRGLTANDLRAAYQAVAPVGSAAGMTVATAQFSGWLRTDLETYAAATGVPMPVVTERTTGGVRADVPDGRAGEVEAALDHQALLAAAPGAAHMVFFGRNSEIGALQLYDAIATSAERDEFDVLSISWGQCELEMTRGAMTAISDALGRVVAAGKTVFAASGDTGATDCLAAQFSRTASVDFPASSPHVVAVGGTRLARDAGGSWTEVAWNDPAPDGRSAGGGGFSAIFPRPAWQPASTPDDGAAAPARMVPDIAAVADPKTGFGFFAASEGGWLVGGGTSLAAPVAAGHFAASLAAVGKRNGLGRALHPLLYANPQAFRDVVVGDNFGYSARTGYDLVGGLGAPQWKRLFPYLATGPIVSVPATTRSRTVPVTVTVPPGRTFSRYRVCVSDADAHCDTADVALDPAGAPFMLTLAPGRSRTARVIVVGFDDEGREFPGAAYTTYDVTAPHVSASARLTTSTSGAARFAWGAVDPAPGGAVAGYEVRVTRYGVAAPLRTYRGQQTSWTTSLDPGGVYTLAVRATDTIGNVSPWRRTTIAAPVDDTQLSRAGSWRTAASAASYRGSSTSSSRAGATATIRVRGSSADLLLGTGPAGGFLDVYLDGELTARVDTYSVVPAQRSVRVARWRGPAPRTITLRVVGAGSSRSRGTQIVLDGIRINWN